MSLYDYVTGSSTLPFSASIAVPAMYAPITAQSVREGFRSLADRTAYLRSELETKFSFAQVVKNDYTNEKAMNLTGTSMVPLHGFSFGTGLQMDTSVGYSSPGAVTASYDGWYAVDINLTLCTTSSILKQFFVSAMRNNGGSLTQWNNVESVNVSNTVTGSVTVNDVIYLNSGSSVCVGIQSLRANEQVKLVLGSLLLKRLVDGQ